MATITMNVDSCRNMQNTINSVRDQIAQQVSSLDSSVNGVVGADWIAPSANQFQSAYQEWANTMRQMMEQLATLNQRLAAEISEFEQAASALQ